MEDAIRELLAKEKALEAEVEVWKSRYEESNHHLDLMVECYGMGALVELVESEKG